MISRSTNVYFLSPSCFAPNSIVLDHLGCGDPSAFTLYSLPHTRPYESFWHYEEIGVLWQLLSTAQGLSALPPQPIQCNKAHIKRSSQISRLLSLTNQKQTKNLFDHDEKNAFANNNAYCAEFFVLGWLNIGSQAVKEVYTMPSPLSFVLRSDFVVE